jgi:ribose/xylose/arabinose/galactoside ABC-type transport system permease subunit
MSTGPDLAPAATAQSTALGVLVAYVHQRRSLVAIIRLIVFGALAILALTTPGFLSKPSILSLLTTVSFIGCVAVGMTLITISGNIMSFSLGALVGATAMIFIAAVNLGGVVFAFLVALAFGALVNATQGFIIGWIRANPIIVSIAATALIAGAAEAFAEHGTIYVAAGTSYGFFRGAVAGIPVEFLVFLGSVAAGQVVLSFTRFGRNIYMLGSSFGAAEVVGFQTWRTVTGAYAWAGMFTALAGIVLAIRYDSASMAYGSGYEYDAIAAVLVGGTAIKGGEGSALRTLLGAMVIAIIQVVLLLRGFRVEWQYLITGMIVLGMVMLQTSGTRDR